MRMCNETFTQSILLGSPQKIKTKQRQKITTTSLESENSFFLCIQQLLAPACKDQRKRDKKERNWQTQTSLYSSVYKINVIPSKANQKLSIFSLGFYYFSYSIQSILKYFFEVFWHPYSVLKWKIGFITLGHLPQPSFMAASRILAVQDTGYSGGRMEIQKISSKINTSKNLSSLEIYTCRESRVGSTSFKVFL